jgi:hypothetical protein
MLSPTDLNVTISETMDKKKKTLVISKRRHSRNVNLVVHCVLLQSNPVNTVRSGAQCAGLAYWNFDVFCALF